MTDVISSVSTITEAYNPPLQPPGEILDRGRLLRSVGYKTHREAPRRVSREVRRVVNLDHPADEKTKTNLYCTARRRSRAFPRRPPVNYHHRSPSRSVRTSGTEPLVHHPPVLQLYCTVLVWRCTSLEEKGPILYCYSIVMSAKDNVIIVLVLVPGRAFQQPDGYFFPSSSYPNFPGLREFLARDADVP